jgi:hypothetical protein
MTSKTIECAFCHKAIEQDSVFCRYCGQAISTVPADRQRILDRTSDFFPIENVVGALEAVNEYVARWSDSPEVRDARFARQCMGFLLQFDNIPEIHVDYEDQSGLATAVGEGLPLILSNGLATAGRVPHPDKAKRFRDWMAAAHKKCGSVLDALYKHADDEAQSFLVEGRSQASIRGLTNEYFFKEAEIHHAAYEARDFDAAYSGFSSLKELSPHDGYVRNMLGSILSQKGEHLPALREFLYGIALYPTDLHLASNTMRYLCGLRLYPAVIEIAHHYTVLGGNPDDGLIRPWVALARACSAAACARYVLCRPEDFSEDAPDLIDEVVFPRHPWIPGYLICIDDALANKRVFISYRRAGGVDYARRLERALKDKFPSTRVFRDESSMAAGQDFTDQLRDEINRADVFLALIDRDWTGSGQKGISRLLDPQDVLRREIACALKRKEQNENVIVPLLLEDARMPGEGDFPKEILAFSRIHALNLSEARFDNDLERVIFEIGNLLGFQALGERSKANNLKRLEALWKIDPEAANKWQDELFGPAIEELPRIIVEKSVGGKGVRYGKVLCEGIWECSATGPSWRITIRFETEEGPGWPFHGRFVIEQGAAGITSDEEIRGTWMEIIDRDNKLLLGLFLDGLKSGTVFKLRIPFDREVGRDLVGTDQQGITYVSRNIEPRQPRPF